MMSTKAKHAQFLIVRMLPKYVRNIASKETLQPKLLYVIVVLIISIIIKLINKIIVFL